MVRMGVRASLAAERQPVGWSAAKVVTFDKAGSELARELRHEPSVTLNVVQFVDLSDGRRVTTEACGDMALTVPRQYTVAELHGDLRESSSRTSCARSTTNSPTSRAGRT